MGAPGSPSTGTSAPKSLAVCLMSAGNLLQVAYVLRRRPTATVAVAVEISDER
jgi:hypothetical protein